MPRPGAGAATVSPFPESADRGSGATTGASSTLLQVLTRFKRAGGANPPSGRPLATFARGGPAETPLAFHACLRHVPRTTLMRAPLAMLPHPVT